MPTIANEKNSFEVKFVQRGKISSRTNIPPAKVSEMCFLLLNNLIDNYQDFLPSVFLYETPLDNLKV